MSGGSQNFGKEAEEAAAAFLERLGYAILERNWRYKKLEIDIIAMYKNELVFVEVKARSTDYFGDPESFVSRAKQKRIVCAADQYILEKNFHGEARFDIIAALPKKNGFSLQHIPQAFAPSII